jgi:antitoxin YefM
LETLSYTQLRENLASVMDEVCASRAPVIVTRQRAPSVVMISLEEWESWQETFHLLRSPRNAERLLSAIRGADAGDLEERGPIDPA